MFPLLPELVLLESDQHLEIYTLSGFQITNPTSEALGSGNMAWLSAFFSLPNTNCPMCIQQLTEVILSNIHNFMMIRTFPCCQSSKSGLC
jgi:hypothetical protein